MNLLGTGRARAAEVVVAAVMAALAFGCGASGETSVDGGDGGADAAKMGRGMMGLPDVGATDDATGAEAGVASDAAGIVDGSGVSQDGPVADATLDHAADRAPDVATQPDAPIVNDSAVDGPSPDAPPAICEPGGTCEALQSEYAKALSQARSCNLLLKGQCAETAMSDLACGGCSVWVNSAAETDVLVKKWSDAGCDDKCRYVCPAVLCTVLRSGTCSDIIYQPAASGAPAADIILPIEQGICADQPFVIGL